MAEVSLFTSEDLTLNRQGKVSPAQLQTLKVKWERNTNLAKKIITGLAGVVIIGVLSQLIRGKLGENGVYIAIGLIVFTVLFYVGVMKYTHMKVAQFSKGDIPVQCIKGAIELASQTFSGRNINTAQKYTDQDIRTNYSIKVEGRTYYIDKQTFSYLENGQNYAIYFVKTSGPVIDVLSWENLAQK